MRTGPPIAHRLGPTLAVLAGVALVAVGTFFGARMIQFVNTATPAEGKVVALESRRGTTSGAGRSRRRTYRPVFEFKDAQGAVHRVTESVGSRPALFKRGEGVTVLYDPAEPERARIKAISTLWFAPGLAIVIGGIFVLVGCVLWRKVGRKFRGR